MYRVSEDGKMDIFVPTYHGVPKESILSDSDVMIERECRSSPESLRKAYLCNILQYFTAVKIIIFR